MLPTPILLYYPKCQNDLEQLLHPLPWETKSNISFEFDFLIPLVIMQIITLGEKVVLIGNCHSSLFHVFVLFALC